MIRFWYLFMYCLFFVVYGLFWWHLVRWDNPYHRTYSLTDEKEIVYHDPGRIKSTWHLEQCGNLKGHIVPCKTLQIPLPSTVVLILIPIIVIILKEGYENEQRD